MQEIKCILEQIENLRQELNESISIHKNFTDKKILTMSIKLDNLILQYYAYIEEKK